MTSPGHVLAFWFGRPDDPAHLKKREKWFKKDPTFDHQIATEFLPLYETAVSGGLDDWRAAAPGCLALILVLDQFPRNMFRNTARAFATDAMAREAARHGVDQGFDKTVPPVHRAFFYLPFEHSENLDDQRLSIELFRNCEPHENYQSSLDYALRHMAVIERFGRFPYRNAALGRVSSPEEQEYVDQPNRGF
jgi:uncharacterized protein (DUF924 family)